MWCECEMCCLFNFEKLPTLFGWAPSADHVVPFLPSFNCCFNLKMMPPSVSVMQRWTPRLPPWGSEGDVRRRIVSICRTKKALPARPSQVSARLESLNAISSSSSVNPTPNPFRWLPTVMVLGFELIPLDLILSLFCIFFPVGELFRLLLLSFKCWIRWGSSTAVYC